MIMMKKMLITAVLGLAICCAVLIYFMNSVADGQYIGSSVSPDKTAKINVYLVSPALSDDAVRCECEFIDSGQRRNVYYAYHWSDASVEWVDEQTVIINGKELNVESDLYDWRKEITET